MTANRVSLEDLRAFIEAIIEEHMGSARSVAYKQQSSRPVEEVRASIRANLWTPPPGTPSSLDMLHEDRDR